MRCVTIWGINVLGRGKKKYKCPKWRVYPVTLRNNQSVSFSETYKVQGREVEDENNITGVLGFRGG